LQLAALGRELLDADAYAGVHAADDRHARRTRAAGPGQVPRPPRSRAAAVTHPPRPAWRVPEVSELRCRAILRPVAVADPPFRGDP
jgi:hypothetical protein